MATSIGACGGDGDNVPSPTMPSNHGPGGGGSSGQVAGYDEHGNPLGPDGKPIEPTLHGTYELSNTFDLTTTGVMPKVLAETLQALSDFREKPANTMAMLLDAANLPVVDTVLNVIPSGIRRFVLGFIDEYIKTTVYKDVPIIARVTGLLDDLASIVTKFELVTALELPEGDAQGDGTAKHTIRGVAYHWDTKRNVITAPEVVAKLTSQDVNSNAVLLQKRSAELETGRLALRDHRFSIPVGSFAVLAVDKFVQDKFNQKDLRAAVGSVIDCKTLAAAVASRCIDPPGDGRICVGHAKDLEFLCSAGLDIVVSVVKGQIKKFDIPLLELKDGTAQMWDAPAPEQALDGTISRLDKGFWTAFVNVAGEQRPVLATFTGKRVEGPAAAQR